MHVVAGAGRGKLQKLFMGVFDKESATAIGPNHLIGIQYSIFRTR